MTRAVEQCLLLAPVRWPLQLRDRHRNGPEFHSLQCHHRSPGIGLYPR